MDLHELYVDIRSCSVDGARIDDGGGCCDGSLGLSTTKGQIDLTI